MRYRWKLGNPIRSDAVNQMIRKVKKVEVRREGVESSARRPLKFDEFKNLVNLLQSETSWKRYRTSAA